MHKAGVLFDLQRRQVESLKKSKSIKSYEFQEFFSGEDLESKTAKGYPENAEEFTELATSLIANLRILQENQILHLDLKRDNVIKLDGENHVVFIDYGKSMAVGKNKNLRGEVRPPVGTVGMGSIEYVDMTIEPTTKSKIQAVFSYQSDIFSVGKMLKEISQEKGIEIPDNLKTIIDKMHRRHDQDPYSNAEEIVNSLSKELQSKVGEKVQFLESYNYQNGEALLRSEKIPEVTFRGGDVAETVELHDDKVPNQPLSI
jgi:serine/threonine protein kinase